MKHIKQVLVLIGFFLFCMATVMVFGIAVNMTNTPSDFKFAGGVSILMFLAFLWFMAGSVIYKEVREYFDTKKPIQGTDKEDATTKKEG